MSLLIIIGLSVAIAVICVLVESVGVSLKDLVYAAYDIINPDPVVQFSDIWWTNGDDNKATGNLGY